MHPPLQIPAHPGRSHLGGGLLCGMLPVRHHRPVPHRPRLFHCLHPVLLLCLPLRSGLMCQTDCRHVLCISLMRTHRRIPNRNAGPVPASLQSSGNVLCRNHDCRPTFERYVPLCFPILPLPHRFSDMVAGRFGLCVPVVSVRFQQRWSQQC